MRSKLDENNTASELIDSFEVEANLQGLLKAKNELADAYYLCNPVAGIDIKCGTEAEKRIQELKDNSK